MVYQSLVGAVALALVHIHASKLQFLDRLPRSRWLSVAGGVAVAYVLVHLMPELQHYEQVVSERAGDTPLVPNDFVWLVSLAGFVAFYGLEKLAANKRRVASNSPRGQRIVFWLHIPSYGFYNALLGYLLVREDRSWSDLLLFVVGIGLHFVVNDHSLRQHYREPYRHVGRWLLSAAVLAGWVVGVATEIHQAVTAVVIAFLAGGILLNTFKEELPEERESNYWAFALGAFAYSAILVAA